MRGRGSVGKEETHETRHSDGRGDEIQKLPRGRLVRHLVEKLHELRIHKANMRVWGPFRAAGRVYRWGERNYWRRLRNGGVERVAFRGC